jgi:nucleoside-diphosphate-sugar epimerase
MNKILILGNGYIADNFIFSVKDLYNVTVYARNKNVEYPNVTYIYGETENLDLIENSFDNIFILSGISRPNESSLLNDVIYANVFLVSKILDFAAKNNSKIFYPATSLALSNKTSKLNYYSYSHTIAIDIIKQYNSNYTICYLHNIYGSLTETPKKNKMVIDKFIDCYYENQPVTLINNGLQRRIFTHIADVVNYMIYSLNDKNTEVNLIKNNTMYSIKEIVELLNLQTNNEESKIYSLDDPYILPIDDIGDWNESIDIKEWIINKIKI